MPVAPVSAVPVDPIISRLRPRDVVGIIDQSFRIYRRHFLAFLAIIAVVHIPLQALIQGANVFLLGTTLSRIYGSSYYDYNTSPATINNTLTSSILLTSIVYGLTLVYQIFMAFSQAALTSAVADGYLDKPVSFGTAYRSVFRRLGPIFGLMLLEFLIYLAALVPAIVVIAVAVGALLAGTSGSTGGGAVLICMAFPLMFAAFGFIIYALVRLQVAVPALVVENLGPRQAIRRSWQMLKGYWWRTAALMLIIAIINLLVSSGPAALISWLTLLVVRVDPTISQAISSAVTVLTTALFIPVQLTASTLYYFDTRVRREGFDIETAVSQAYPGAYPLGQPYPGYDYNGQYAQPQYGQGQYAAPAFTRPLGTTPEQPQYPYNQYGQWPPQQNGYNTQPGVTRPVSGNDAEHYASPPLLGQTENLAGTPVSPVASEGNADPESGPPTPERGFAGEAASAPREQQAGYNQSKEEPEA